MQQSILNVVIARRGLLLKVSSFILLLVSFNESQHCITIVPAFPKEPWLVEHSLEHLTI